MPAIVIRAISTCAPVGFRVGSLGGGTACLTGAWHPVAERIDRAGNRRLDEKDRAARRDDDALGAIARWEIPVSR